MIATREGGHKRVPLSIEVVLTADVVISFAALLTLVIPGFAYLAPISLFGIYFCNVFGYLGFFAYPIVLWASAQAAFRGERNGRATVTVMVVVSESLNLLMTLWFPRYSVIESVATGAEVQLYYLSWMLRGIFAVLAIAANLWFLVFSPAARRFFRAPDSRGEG